MKPSTVQTRQEARAWIVLECPTCGHREVVRPGSTGVCNKGKRIAHASTAMVERPAE